MDKGNLILTDISQFDVDFVIPKWGVDIPIGIDPFLLYKSSSEDFKELHTLLLSVFNKGIDYIKIGDLDKAKLLLDFPEVSEIGLGYSQSNKNGSGIGTFLSDLIIQTLLDSPKYLERGVKHIEELQLISIGIGPDRISDMTANIIKNYLISYTKKQCEIWGIKLHEGVPVNHILNSSDYTWFDGYFDLPLSETDLSPLIFVPRRIVRALPWINYNDFLKMEFSAYLRSKKVKQNKSTHQMIKSEIIGVTRNEIERIDKFIKHKEDSSSDAQPSNNYIQLNGLKQEGDNLIEELKEISTGTKEATKYQLKVLEILNFLFNPDLIDGNIEVQTIDGTERRDIIFTNDSDKTFWSYIRIEHSSIILMFEVKNTKKLDNFNINQAATYLGSRLGQLGFIVTRNKVEMAQTKKIYSVYNDSIPRKIILVLTDEDLISMIHQRIASNEPMRYIQKLYRDFRTSVQ